MRAPLGAYFKTKASKVREGKSRACNYLIFSKAHCCSLSQIHNCYYYKKLDMGRAMQSKSLMNLL